MTKERKQNVAIGDEVKLRLFVYNSNNRQDPEEVEKVDIYFLDPTEVTEENPDGRRLVETVTTITHEEEGQFSVTVSLDLAQYTIGKYLDIWTVETRTFEPVSNFTQCFEVFSDLWYTNPEPVVYDFSFNFRPNKIRHGSKRWLDITVTPNVPRATDLERYYRNLAVSTPFCISIEQACTECMPRERDLRLIVDKVSVELRDQGTGSFFLDTTELDPGIYNIWFEMEFGESTYVSENQQLQIYV